jgi:signal transduction histidine kinase/ActR/RegA family two-component response regulator
VGQDAPAISELFATVDVETTIVTDMTGWSLESLQAEALLMTEEGLELPGLSYLVDALSQQPAWSELPVIFLTRGGESRFAKLLEMIALASGSVMVLERPIATSTLLRALQVALRSRGRQYQVRQLLEEQQHTTEREQKLRQAAEEAVRLQDEFLATLSHELRNPLNVIVGYSDLLQRSNEVKASPHLLQMSAALRRSALAQSRLIRDLLDLSRLRSRKLTLNKETVSIVEAVNNALETVRGDAAAKRITIDVHAAAEPLFVDADPLRLEQIAWNLLTNAVKFTPADGQILVRLASRGTEVVLSVEDTGAGIDSVFLPHIFEMFRQGDTSANRAHGGMGIGLALVRELVELHGGSVTVHSEGVNRGTQFTVRLPAKADNVATITPARASQVEALKETSVLVIDDHPDTAEMLRLHLEGLGAEVFAATSGREALRIARAHSFDAVLSDLSMPEIDGFELLRQLRQLPNKEHVPAVAMTGLGQREDQERSRSAGFAAHVTKPLDMDTLVEIVQRLTQKPHSTGNSHGPEQANS